MRTLRVLAFMEEEDEFGDLYADVAGVSLKDDDASSSSSPYSRREEEEEGAVEPSDNLELFYGQTTIRPPNKDCYSDSHDGPTDKGGGPRENYENQKELADDAHAQLAQMDANANGNGLNWGNNNNDSDSESDSDSDSDDLDILVNDDQHQHRRHHHRAEQQQQEISENGGGSGSDEDDDDDDLVIVTGDEQQPITIVDTEWGDEGLQLPLEGEISLTVPPPPLPTRDDRGAGISALNSHYSQFKYVRRGAATVSGTVPSSSGVVQNQSKPSVFNGGVTGSGRSDRNCSGVRGHMQRSFISGVGMPPWSGGPMSKMPNGFEFTLPSNKTIFDINVDKFEEKRWQQPGLDVSDFFNFDLDEDSWKHYCRQLGQLRLESTMQRKICVYESGRSEQDYDPDLPPELAAASGLLEALGEHKQHRQDNGSLAGTVLARGRPQFPTGRAIQVEGGIGERLPSVDVRRPRLRDSDAVIQIVLHDATEEDSAAPINAPETIDNRNPETVDNTSKKEEPVKVTLESEGDQKEFDAGYSFQELQAAGKWERGTAGVRTHTKGRIGPRHVIDGDGILPLPPGPPVLYQVSTAEPGMYPTEPLGLPPAFRGPQLLVPYKGHLEDERSNRSVVNRGRLTLLDSYQKRSAMKHVIRKRHPVICSMREQEDHNKMHFHMKSESHSRQTPEPSFQVRKEDDNGFAYYSKRQKLNSQKELSESAADDSHLFNMSKNDNCKSESGDSRGSSKYRGDEQEGSIDRQQKKICSLAERKGTRLEEEIHPRDGYRWYGRGDADSDIISLNVRDVLYCHRGRDEVYLYSDPEGMYYRKAKDKCIDKNRDRDGHIKSWRGGDGGVQIQREKNEDVSRRIGKLEKVNGSKHKIKGPDNGRHEREEHLHPRKRKDADDRKDKYNKEDFVSRGIERHIVEQQENEDDFYLRKKKEEDFIERDKLDNDARIRYQTDQGGDISRDKLDMDELQFRRKEEESRRMERFDDTCTRKPNDDNIRRDREDEHWRKSGYEEMYCRRGREEERCLLSEGSNHREDRLWCANGKDENNDREEARVMNFDKYKVYDKMRHEEHSRVRDLIDEEGRSKHHEQDDICSWQDCLAYEQRSSRHDHIYLRHEMSCTVHGMEERRLYRGKHILYTMTSKNFHSNDRHGYSSGLADHKLRNDLAISKGRRKPQDYPSVHQDEKVSARCMDVRETGGKWNGHVDHRSHNHKMPNGTSKRMHEQHGAYHDVAKLEKVVPNGCLSEDELRSGYNNVECWAHHKEKMHDRDSSKHWKEAISFKDDPTKTQKLANEEQINLKVTEMAPAMERQHLKVENWDINLRKAVPNELVNATVSEVVSIDQRLNRQHLEAVAKLEKRRERFKQPIIVEKPVNKKMEDNETTIQNETTEVKQERPARKRKWSGS